MGRTVRGVLCRCPESKRPPAQRDWFVLHRWRAVDPDGVGISKAATSTIECGSCGAIWDTIDRAVVDLLVCLSKHPRVRAVEPRADVLRFVRRGETCTCGDGPLVFLCERAAPLGGVRGARLERTWTADCEACSRRTAVGEAVLGREAL